MTAQSKILPSLSACQARKLAWIWGQDNPVLHTPGSNATWDALVRKGALMPTGQKMRAASGAECDLYRVSDDGVAMLRSYFDRLSGAISRKDAA